MDAVTVALQSDTVRRRDPPTDLQSSVDHRMRLMESISMWQDYDDFPQSQGAAWVGEERDEALVVYVPKYT